MSRDIQRLRERNEKILERFNELSNKKYKDKQMYTLETILEMLADEFYITPRTVYLIVLSEPPKPAEPVDPNQLNLKLE